MGAGGTRSLLIGLCLGVIASMTQGFVIPLSGRTSQKSSIIPSSSSLPRTSSSLQALPGWLSGVSTLKKPQDNNAEEVKRLKTEIYRISKGKDNGLKATEEEAKQVIDLANQLAKLNQIKSIAKTDQVDGTWRLMFTTTKGGSSGKLGPFVGQVDQVIETSSGKYVNFVRLFGGLVEGALEAGWEVTGPNGWKVIFRDITFRILGFPVVDKKPLGGQAGVWRLTYLDEDLRILFAAGMTNQGKPAKVENIYILQKVKA